MSRVQRSISPYAAPLRRAMTDAEAIMWRALRGRRFAGRKFRLQHSIGRYIADFACVEEMLVIELDGGQHSEAIEYDARRTAFMETLGWRVIRFPNREVLINLDGVKYTLEFALGGAGHPHPGPR